ncbi:CHY zinc finger protein [Halorussus caseinilyticus]|uniref:CHY zinc finger protein n=1 Tax=Halorussus caseinilyticus TaxID=3034025 RepID=A0ABD5WS45_9EURY|nr:CHY zinc finger protein [Halorussus sp. DT72]
MDEAGAEREIHGERVRGVGVGPGTRCAHYDSERDVVALRFACCESYFPCFRCHDAAADHDAERLPVESDESAVLCGVCGAELTPREFVDGEHRCPECGVAFNPGCGDHYDRYFDFGE